jgi:tetratricopeptide (TPR) repeat protein
VLGEIRLLRGDRAGAEEAFRQAHELGWNPLPGWALLHAENGQFAAAIKSLQRGLQSPSWADGQRRGILLAQLARIAALAGQLPWRTNAGRVERLVRTPLHVGLRGMYHQARAEIALAEHHSEESIKALRDALAIWLDTGSRINAAHTRLRLAEILALSGDREESDLELSSARKAFAAMDAVPMVARCEMRRAEANTLTS